MLEYLRTHTKTVVWTVVLSFALWGAFSVSSSLQEKGRYAGEVFGKTVSFQEFNQFYRGAQIFSFGEDMTKDPDVLRQMTWQNLIYSKEAKRKNFKVTDDETRQELIRLLANQGFPQADPKAYKQWVVKTLQMEPAAFENQLREVIRVQKLLRGIAQIPLEEPKDDEIRQFHTLENSRIALEGVVFPTVKEAEEFSVKASTPDGWKIETAALGDKILSMPEAPLAETADALRLETADALELQKLPEGAISQPVALGGKIVIFRVTSKKDASTAEFSADEKKVLSEKVMERKKRLYFMSWHMRLMKEAGLKDYTSESEA